MNQVQKSVEPVSTEARYTGLHPYTLEPVFSAKSPQEKLAQRQYFFWYQPAQRRQIEQSLRRIGRADLIPQLFGGMPTKSMPPKSMPTKKKPRRP